MEQSPNERGKFKGGKGAIRGAIDSGSPFSSTNQPSTESRRLGQFKRKRGQDLARAILELGFQGMKDSALKKAASEYYNIPEEEITVEMMMLFRQTEKAIQKADTGAFNAVMDRAHGKPKEKVEMTGKDGKDLYTEKSDDELKTMLQKLSNKLG